MESEIKHFILFIGASILVMSIIFYGFHIDHERLINTRQTISIFIEDIHYQNGGFGCHDITIVKTNMSVIILDHSESLPLGHVMLTIQESIYKGEYKLIAVKKVK